MTGLLNYRPKDKEGAEILDELEADVKAIASRMPDGRRQFYIAAEGDVDLDPYLNEIDPDWERHIERVLR